MRNRFIPVMLVLAVAAFAAIAPVDSQQPPPRLDSSC